MRRRSVTWSSESRIASRRMHGFSKSGILRHDSVFIIIASFEDYDFSPDTMKARKTRQVELNEAYENMRRNVKEDVMQDIDRCVQKVLLIVYL